MFFLGLAGALLLSGYARAEPLRYIIDSSHTDIVWHADHLGFSKSIGEFARSSGFIILDESNPTQSHVEVEVDLGSIQTGDAEFDAHLKSNDFFFVEQYKVARFVSKNVEITGDKTARVEGDLTLHGVTKPIVLDVKLNKIGKNPFSKKETAGFSARTKIYRSQFGITYGLPMVGDEVELIIEAEGNLQAPKTKP
jgi:polyisoprenoid-binding protein YceI